MIDRTPDAGSIRLPGSRSHLKAAGVRARESLNQPASAGFRKALAGGPLASGGSWHLILLLILTVLLLAACAGDSGDPARTVEQYITAKVAGDREALQRLLCSSMEADLDREAMSFNGVDATVENMSCARDGEANTVTCTGAIVAVYAGENREFPLATYNVVQEDGEWKWCGEAG